MKKSLFRLLSIVTLLLLLLFHKTAYEGAKNGLVLWGSVIIPTLLPFMVCSSAIVSLDAIHLLIFPFQIILRRFFFLSDAGSYTFISGLLCGYPMGAKTCNNFLDSERISEKEGNYLLAICNHPSPMFLLGYAAVALPKSVPVWVLFFSLYMPIFLISIAARAFYGIDKPFHSLSVKKESVPSFDDSLMDSCEVMVKIGGYIMLFSILALSITKLPLNLPRVKGILLGFVEITTGIKAISKTLPDLAGGLWICAAAAFGGLSGIFQTKSVIKNAGLSIRHYVAWKVFHTLLTIILFILLARFQALLAAA
ncbi:nucleoside recognition protein [Clostridium sp. E02]|uniref:nucleoside recognition protein n=1 Tax=Clostridium sp. E02 TaxID=2487134 RepID=UPI000F5222B8|nr:nucleoside recognition protein [Clostridium sp. E02]